MGNQQPLVTQQGGAELGILPLCQLHRAQPDALIVHRHTDTLALLVRHRIQLWLQVLLHAGVTSAATSLRTSRLHCSVDRQTTL